MNKFKLLLIAFFPLLLLSSKPLYAAEVSLGFVPDRLMIRQGESGEVVVNLDTGGFDVIGVDLVLTFDQTKVKINDILPLDVFSVENGKIIDNESGVAKYALSNSRGKYVNGSTDIIKVIIEGVDNIERGTPMKFVFEEGKTTDTNVVAEHGVDVLTDVNELNVKVKKASKVLGDETEMIGVDGSGIDDTLQNDTLNGNDGQNEESAIHNDGGLPGKVAGAFSKRRNYLYIIPVLFLAGGMVGVYFYLRRKRSSSRGN